MGDPNCPGGERGTKGTTGKGHTVHQWSGIVSGCRPEKLGILRIDD